MKSYEWDMAQQAFRTVDDPTYDPTVDDLSEAIAKAGYSQEVVSGEDGAIVSIYMTEDKSKPQFYIDIAGQNSGIASLVARDFIALVETLNRIHSLLTLIGLDQFYTARVADFVDREYSQKKR